MSVTTVVDVPIPAKARFYPIYIENGGLSRLGQRLSEKFSLDTKVLIVTDNVVESFYGHRLDDELKKAGFQTAFFVFPAGEASKTLAMAEKIYDKALDFGLSRKDMILALGGGVVGDLAGYCAATFYRGIEFVQVPTTLLAQVDSSVGGKVGVNFRTVKNGIGAFYQPALVAIDPELLSTLSERQVKAGLGEVLKYAMIEQTCCGETGFFDYLDAHADDLDAVMIPVIERCCRMKSMVVTLDETEETGVRFYLNFGHTFAHAYEAATNYTQILHGEAVAMGMIQACRLAETMNIFPAAERERFEALLHRLKLPATPPVGLDPARLVALMRQDKKAKSGIMRFVLPTECIGRVAIRDDVREEQLLKIL